MDYQLETPLALRIFQGGQEPLPMSGAEKSTIGFSFDCLE
jgi:hypothetical protein